MADPDKPVPPRVPFRFTSENARELSRRGNAKLAQLRAAAREREKQAELYPKPDLDEIPTQKAKSAAFLAKRLSRVRLQLCKLDRMIEEETDPQRLDRLASAQARLAEQERLLDDRSLPGSRRPAPEAPVSGIGALMAARRQQPPPADGERRDQK